MSHNCSFPMGTENAAPWLYTILIKGLFVCLSATFSNTITITQVLIKTTRGKNPNWITYFVSWLPNREYQDLEFFPDQLQTFIERCIGPQRFQMWKNFSKISFPFWQVLSFKLTNQVASFIQSANDSQTELFIVCCYWLNVYN